MKVETVVPFLEEIKQHDDGEITMRGFLFWDKQILKLLYQWHKQGGLPNPNVRIALEAPEKPVQEISEGGSYPTTGDDIKLLSELLIEKYKDDPEKMKLVMSVMQNALSEPDWWKW